MMMEQQEVRIKKKKSFDPYFALQEKINSKWITELIVKLKTM